MIKNGYPIVVYGVLGAKSHGQLVLALKDILGIVLLSIRFGLKIFKFSEGEYYILIASLHFDTMHCLWKKSKLESKEGFLCRIVNLFLMGLWSVNSYLYYLVSGSK